MTPAADYRLSAWSPTIEVSVPHGAIDAVSNMSFQLDLILVAPRFEGRKGARKAG